MPTRRLLIADDEAHITYMLSLKLSRANLEVISAADGAEAFRLARERHPDLVITDFQMPVMNGYDLAVRLRETIETTNIPVLMLTARGHRLSVADLAKTNIRHLIAKPFSARELLSKVGEFIDLDSASDASESGIAPGAAAA